MHLIMIKVHKPARQAITTKYLGPTDTKGARIKASCEAGSIIVSWVYNFDASGMHAYAVDTAAGRLMQAAVF